VINVGRTPNRPRVKNDSSSIPWIRVGATARIAVTEDAFTGPPETVATFVQSELDQLGRVIKDSGIEPQ
jgi:hypothetical protein